MLFGRRKPGYTTTVDAASDPEQVILDLQKAEMAAKKKPKAEVFDIDAASETARRLKETGSMFDGSAAKLGEDVIAAVQKETDALAAKQAEEQPAPDYTAQLSGISAQLADMAQQATAETAEDADPFQKPFEEYTTGETLALIGVVLLLVFGVFSLFKNFVL